MKAISDYVSFIITIILTIVGIGIVLTQLIPIIEKNKNAIAIDSTIKQFKLLDFLIKQVASEAIGSQRTFEFNILDGELRINNITNALEYYLASKNLPLDYGTEMKIDNIYLSTGPELREEKIKLILALKHERIKIIGDLNLGKGLHKLCIRKEAEDLENKIVYVKIYEC